MVPAGPLSRRAASGSRQRVFDYRARGMTEPLDGSVRWATDRVEGGTAYLRLTGSLTGLSRSTQLLDELGEHYVNDGVSAIAIDLSETPWIDLEGVAVLISLLKGAHAHDKTLWIEHETNAVASKLRQTGIYGHLTRDRPHSA